MVIIVSLLGPSLHANSTFVNIPLHDPRWHMSTRLESSLFFITRSDNSIPFGSLAKSTFVLIPLYDPRWNMNTRLESSQLSNTLFVSPFHYS